MTSPRRALIVIDVQQEYFDGPLAIQHPPREESLSRIVDAVRFAHEQGVPVAVILHDSGEAAPVFATGSARQAIHPALAAALAYDDIFVKDRSSAFDGTALADWCRARDIDTITLVGYMTNNCVIATAAGAEVHDLAVEVLSDATGAIHLSNERGTVPARAVHETLMTLLHSNFAAVTDTAGWMASVRAGIPTSRSSLIASATAS